MVSWSRSTPWRQGYLVDSETLAQLGITIDGDDPKKLIAVVATHDCDLAQLAVGEPEVELILGKILPDKLDGNYTHCKTARRLHLELTGTDHHLLCEFDASKRIRVLKEHDDPAKAFASYEPARLVLMNAKNEASFNAGWQRDIAGHRSRTSLIAGCETQRSPSDSLSFSRTLETTFQRCSLTLIRAWKGPEMDRTTPMSYRSWFSTVPTLTQRQRKKLP